MPQILKCKLTGRTAAVTGAAKICKADECLSRVLFGKWIRKMGRTVQKVDPKWRLARVGVDCLAYSE